MVAPEKRKHKLRFIAFSRNINERLDLALGRDGVADREVLYRSDRRCIESSWCIRSGRVENCWQRRDRGRGTRIASSAAQNSAVSTTAISRSKPSFCTMIDSNAIALPFASSSGKAVNSDTQQR